MTKQFNTTKEELQKLGQEFKLQAFTLIEDLYNLAFWLVLKKRFAKNLAGTYLSSSLVWGLGLDCCGFGGLVGIDIASLLGIVL